MFIAKLPGVGAAIVCLAAAGVLAGCGANAHAHAGAASQLTPCALRQLKVVGEVTGGGPDDVQGYIRTVENMAQRTCGLSNRLTLSGQRVVNIPGAVPDQTDTRQNLHAAIKQQNPGLLPVAPGARATLVITYDPTSVRATSEPSCSLNVGFRALTADVDGTGTFSVPASMVFYDCDVVVWAWRAGEPSPTSDPWPTDRPVAEVRHVLAQMLTLP